MTLEHEQYSPDSLGDLYGRVTELLGFDADVDEHKVQWLSVGGDGRYRDLFLEILCLSDAGPRLDRSFFSTERLQPRRFQRAILRAARIEGRRSRFPRTCAPTSPPASRRPWKRP